MMKRIFCFALLALTVLMMPMAAAGATWVHSRDLGMRADNPRLPLAERQKTGRANADILRTFLERGTHLILDDTYYVTVDYRSLSAGGTRFLVIKHPLHLKGGGIRVKYFGFQMREGSSLTAEGVRFESDGVFPLIWNGGRSTNFGSDNVLLRGMIGSLRFTDCHFSCRMLQLGFADLAPLGVKVPKKRAGSEDFETDAKGRPVYKSASESVDSLGIGELVFQTLHLGVALRELHLQVVVFGLQQVVGFGQCQHLFLAATACEQHANNGKRHRVDDFLHVKVMV